MTGHELQQGLKNKNITITHSADVTDKMVDDYFDTVAQKYTNVDEYLTAIEFESGKSTTVGIQGIGTEDQIITDVSSFILIDKDAGSQVIDLNYSEFVVYGTAWGNDTVLGGRVLFYFDYVDKDGEDQTWSHYLEASTSTFFNYSYPEPDYCEIRLGYYVSIESEEDGRTYAYLNGYVEADVLYENHIDPITHFTGIKTLRKPQEGFQKMKLPFDIGYGEYSITLTRDESGGGGGSSSTVLKFSATAGLSGRHCDPIHTQNIRRPTARTERPAYGCGGYGGHGGGGGAGASTVVIRKFTSGKADKVELIPVVQRHGYGSGGGAGGRGGDGCVLVFW